MLNGNNATMKRTIILIISAVTLLLQGAVAQEYSELNLVERSFELCHEQNSRDSFKGQILKGKRNGMGYLISRNETLYIGDFQNNSISGYGLQIATNGISNCTDARYYVGNWQGGKKSGFGICYTTTGDVIYAGNFANDKPTDRYPSTTTAKRRFAIIHLSKRACYMGEVKGSYPDGFGTLIFDNGDMWQGTFKEGQRSGIGLYLCYDGEWETVSFKGDEATTVSSSMEYREIDATRKAALKAYRATLYAELGALLNDVSELMLEYQRMHNARYASAGGGAYGESDGDSDTDTSSGNKSDGRTCPDCNGKKYESTSYTYAAGSTGGVRQPYHHTGGSGCPYCSSTSDHYHYPCSECMGKGKIYW